MKQEKTKIDGIKKADTEPLRSRVKQMPNKTLRRQGEDACALASNVARSRLRAFVEGLWVSPL